MQLFIRLATFRTLHWSHSSEFFHETWAVLLKTENKNSKKLYSSILESLESCWKCHSVVAFINCPLVLRNVSPKWLISVVVCIRACSLATSKGAELVLYWRGAKNTRQISRHLAGVSSIANNLQPTGTPALKSHFYRLWATLLLRPHMNTRHFETHLFSVG